MHQAIKEPTDILDTYLYVTAKFDNWVRSSFLSTFKLSSSDNFSKFNLEVVYTPSYVREVWHYKDANTELTRQAINELKWQRPFLNTKFNEKVDIFNITILNILSNFIPHEFVVCNDKDPPWFNKKITALIQEKMLHLKIAVMILVILIWNVVWNIVKPAWMLLLQLLKKNIITRQ